MRVLLLTVALVLAVHSPSAAQIHLQKIGTYKSGTYDQGGAEIAAYDPINKRLWVVNGGRPGIDVLDIRNPSLPALAFTVSMPARYGTAATNVAIRGTTVAVAVPAPIETDNGHAVFFDLNGSFINAVMVGSLPDMITFSPDGLVVLTANEGQPSDDYSIDPEGSVSIIDISNGIGSLTQSKVTTVGFAAFNGTALDPSVRVFGNNANVARDMEPEYIAVSSDSRFAYVTLQENNAIATLDLRNRRFTRIAGLGFKNHATAGNELDASDRDRAINIANWPVFGMYQPDAIAIFRHQGRNYLITANEGDARDYSALGESARVSSLSLDPNAFPNGTALKANSALGRLTVTNRLGDTDQDGDFDRLYAFGSRSFSIWTEGGMRQVYDSGADLEKMTAATNPSDFNSDNADNGSFDTRSDNKGPEPEGVVVAEVINGRYAFIGLERIGGVVVYNISDPLNPAFVTHVNDRDFSGSGPQGTAGDLGPEGLVFIPASTSPTGVPLLVVANEVSGTTTIFSISDSAASKK